MVNVNDYQILLTEDDWVELEKELGDKFAVLSFEAAHAKYDLLEMINGKMNVDHWKNEFNNKLLSIGINYCYMYVYYKKMNGFDVYKEKDSEKLSYHFWFSYETESLLARLFTLIDNLYHILNIKYNLDIPEGIRFRGKLVKSLSSVNQDLADYLTSLKIDQRYDKAQIIRNDFTHNHSPLNLTPGFKKVENGGVFTKGEYTKPEEVVKCIDDFIKLLAELTNEIKKYV